MIKKILITIFFIICINSIAYSAGNSNNNTNSENQKPRSYLTGYKKILKAIRYEKKGNIKKAKKLYTASLKYLYFANDEKKLDPDILNYLGFANRKLGNFEDAEVYYLLGLDQDPNHLGINEYLGELYVQTKRIDKAKERLKVLEKCNCEEYIKLKNVIKSGKSKY